MGREDSLTEQDLRSLGQSLQGSTQDLELDRLQLIDINVLRTGGFYRCRTDIGEIAVKVGWGWSADSARATYEELARVGAVLRMSSTIDAAEALGWTPSPPSVWMRYIPGPNLEMILSEPQSLTELNADGSIDDKVRRIGSGLAVYHRNSVGSDEHNEAAHRRELAQRARVIRVPEHSIITDTSDPIVSLYQDYSPANIQIAASGGVFAVDPPMERAYGFPHKDVARFIRGMSKGLSSPAWSGHRDEAKETLGRLSAIFVSGYESETSTSLTTPDDRWLMLFYETLRRGQRTLNQVRSFNLGGARRSISRGLQMRRQLIDGAPDPFLDHLSAEVSRSSP